MPANLKELRTRIKSVRNTEQITKAMKLVSTAKFGRAQVAVVQSKPYSRALVRLVKETVASLNGDVSHPLAEKSKSPRVLVVVISSERGLCGSYNANVSKLALRHVEELVSQGREVSITCLGKKASQVLGRNLRDKGFQVVQGPLTEIESNPMLIAASKTIRLVTTPFEKRVQAFSEVLADAFRSAFEAGGFGELHFVLTRFESAGSLPLSIEKLLPLATPEGAQTGGAAPLFEPDAGQLLQTLLPRYLTMTVHQFLLEAIASEHGARMAAMDSATRNAGDMLRRLQITYQRARQAAITKELIEIISGADAL